MYANIQGIKRCLSKVHNPNQLHLISPYADGFTKYFNSDNLSVLRYTKHKSYWH
jgi:hypothetical protein